MWINGCCRSLSYDFQNKYPILVGNVFKLLNYISAHLQTPTPPPSRLLAQIVNDNRKDCADHVLHKVLKKCHQGESEGDGQGRDYE